MRLWVWQKWGKNKLTCEICWKIVIQEPPAFQGHVKSNFVFLGTNIILTAPCGAGPRADRRRGTVCTLGSLWANECTSHLQGELEADWVFKLWFEISQMCYLLVPIWFQDFCEWGDEGGWSIVRALTWGQGNLAQPLWAWQSALCVCVCVDKSSHLLVGVLWG